MKIESCRQLYKRNNNYFVVHLFYCYKSKIGVKDMSSVTRRINEIKQPRGGYIKLSQFEEIIFNDGIELGEENLHPSIIGLVVDYLTRYLTGASVQDAFMISILGYKARIRFLGIKVICKDNLKKIDIETLLKQIKGLDDKSITAACKACTYDVWFRNPMGAAMAKEVDEIAPDKTTIENIKTMINRSIAFWKKYGPVTAKGFTFETAGYTATVNSGDGDYLTSDTIWDFKVSKSKPTNKHTLQLLMYWIMGQHSGKSEFKTIKRLGIFNPRLNTAYLLDMSAVSEEIIKEVETEVICYK